MRVATFQNHWGPGASSVLAALVLLGQHVAMKAQVTTASASVGRSGSPTYPVKVSANRRYLVDQNNTPFLIAGDSPQGLIYMLSEAETEMYFADRQAHGFNTAGWIDVVCAGRDYPHNVYGATADGIRPFSGFVQGGTDWTHYDLRKPNEAYFTRLDHIVEMAAKHDILVFLDPIETAGWLQTLRNNGPAADYAYGQYLGNRYKKYSNVAWINGNDFGGWQISSDDALVRAVARGIRSADPGHIQTVEFNPPTGSSLDDPTWAPMIEINGSYIYGPTYIQMLHSYNQKPIMPTYLMEAHYELENVGNDYGTPAVLRRQEYWTMLTGGTGQFYGNNYTWTFRSGWQGNIDTAGVTQFTIWKNFFASLRWQDLVPDQGHSVVIEGLGNYGDLKTQVSKSDYATAAKIPDGSTAVVYIPTERPITVNLASLRGPARARWFDPSDGTYQDVANGPFINHGHHQFIPPGKNHDGDGDWVLLLEASAGSR